MLKSLFKAAANVVLIPVDLVKDAVTVGGLSTDQKDPYTIQRIKGVVQNLEKVKNEVEEAIKP